MQTSRSMRAAIPYSRMTPRAVRDEVHRLTLEEIRRQGWDAQQDYARAFRWVLFCRPALNDAYSECSVRRQSPSRQAMTISDSVGDLRARVRQAGLGDLDRAAAKIAEDPNTLPRLSYSQAARKLASDQIAAHGYKLAEMRDDLDPRVRMLLELWNLT